MDNDLFVDILRILKLEFIENNYEIIDYLKGISKLPRLQMLVMFCTDNEMSCKYNIIYQDSIYQCFSKLWVPMHFGDKFRPLSYKD